MPNQFFSPEGDLENYFVTEYWLIDQYIGDTLWTWGRNDFGQLGVNDTFTRCTPVTTFAGGSNWKQVSSDDIANLAIKTDGTLWTWGSNSLGQLGVNDTNNRCTPVTTFAGGTNWKQAAAETAARAIKTDGTLWTWGYNIFGQLGVNDTTSRPTPVTTFAGGTNWKQVSGSSRHTAAIKTDGTLWTWGENFYGHLGINLRFSGTGRTTPVTTFAGGNNWKQVSCGLYHTAAIKTDGTLWAWGDNTYEQIFPGDGDVRKLTPVQMSTIGPWRQVSCGYYHTAAIKSNGTLYLWGRNDYGQLGNNRGAGPAVTTFAGGTNWKQVSCGYRNTVAIKTDGTLWAWGDNTYGQLGVNDTFTRCTPVTTFAGGTNWKQVFCGSGRTIAVTSGTDPTFFIS